MNERIRAADLADETRIITGRHTTIAKAFEQEKPTLLPGPAEPFDPARLLTARVDSRARVIVDGRGPPVRDVGPVGRVLLHLGDDVVGAQRRVDYRHVLIGHRGGGREAELRGERGDLARLGPTDALFQGHRVSLTAADLADRSADG